MRVIECLDAMNNQVATRLENSTNMETFAAYVKDPSVHSIYPECKVLCPNRRLSDERIGQYVLMGKKPTVSKEILPAYFM
eukprot:2789154-Amphidinium_carterae.7